ncbi:isopenicillin N synthase family dioxygenase [Pseudorhodobacter ferrugineus]|uniref:isopenicillin N synthase family dioxygenase n=1 Tax=Pseudorhodobacter ferrugineus TaxID=77008 RepID=UPI0009DBF25E|nr:2-oxoglutarate and iron-dependent oxygenase domain-containing protein [Pseudorhodobacter ferrugineus]
MASFSNTHTTDAPRLPLISIADLSSGDPLKISAVADAIGLAAREYGFFRICDHGIDLDLIEAVYHTAKGFFALSDAQKRRYYIGASPNHRGYVPFTEKGDYPDEVHRSYEAFDLGLDLPRNDPDFLAGNRVLGPNVWPDFPGFKSTVSQYYGHVSALGRLICGALELHLGLPKGAMTNHMTKPISQLRLLHYVRQAHTSDHRSVNMGAHTDYECLTLLHTRNQGLQVMTARDEWIDVPVDPTALVCNIGDMLEAWSNGLLRSTPHRVVNASPERFSLPYFVAANHDTLIEPFPQLVTPDRPAQYEPFLAGAHLERMLMRDFPYFRHQARQHPAIIPSVTRNPFEGRLTQSVP